MTHEALGAGDRTGRQRRPRRDAASSASSPRTSRSRSPRARRSARSTSPTRPTGRSRRTRRTRFVVCHALTGDAHAAGHHGDPEHVGWWDTMIGPGKPVDTDRYFVVCSNLLGGCKGTTGPSSIDPRTGRPYGLRFPLFTMSDLVDVQRALLRHLGIERLRGGDRRLARRHAGAPVGARPPGRDRPRRARLRLGPADGAEHRALGRRARLDHEGRALPRRRLLRHRPRPRRRALGGADARPHHLRVRGGAPHEVRARRSAATARPPSGSTSRSRATSSTRARSSSSASTPTPTSTSRG